MKTWFHSTRALYLVLFLLACPALAQGGNSKHQPQILERVHQAVVQETSHGNHSLVIFDLDDTLFDTRPRHKRILREFARQQGIVRGYPAEATLLRKIRVSQISYHLEETFLNLGITSKELLEKAKAFWLERFFTNEYCSKDSPIPGAVAYVKLLSDAGAQIVYLTGRDQPRMEEGTRSALLNRGFPLDVSTQLIMKPDKNMDDTVFKQGVFESLKKEGSVIAGFENEPRNINSMNTAFPEAIMVFLDTRHSNKPDVPSPDIAWVKDFKQPDAVRDPVAYARQKTEMDDCYDVFRSGQSVTIECVSEVYPGDGIECPGDGGHCEPVFNIPTRDYCQLVFEKKKGGYYLIDQACGTMREE